MTWVNSNPGYTLDKMSKHLLLGQSMYNLFVLHTERVREKREQAVWWNFFDKTNLRLNLAGKMSCSQS